MVMSISSSFRVASQGPAQEQPGGKAEKCGKAKTAFPKKSGDRGDQQAAEEKLLLAQP